jgi:hypothetical protein
MPKKDLLLSDSPFFNLGFKSFYQEYFTKHLIIPDIHGHNLDMDLDIDIDIDIVYIKINQHFEFLKKIISNLILTKPELKIVVISEFDEIRFAPTLIKLGIKAFIQTSSSNQEFIDVIKIVNSGGIYTSEPLRDGIVNDLWLVENALKLTRKEVDIIKLIGIGHTTKIIAEETHTSPQTVAVHRANIKRKLNIKSNAMFYQYCFRYQD